jgi:hypothetical protein
MNENKKTPEITLGKQEKVVILIFIITFTVSWVVGFMPLFEKMFFNLHNNILRNSNHHYSLIIYNGYLLAAANVYIGVAVFNKKILKPLGIPGLLRYLSYTPLISYIFGHVVWFIFFIDTELWVINMISLGIGFIIGTTLGIIHEFKK